MLQKLHDIRPQMQTTRLCTLLLST